VTVAESDLFIVSDSDVEEKAMAALVEVRREIERYISFKPFFAKSLEPVEVGNTAAPIIRDMAKAAQLFHVGPMAAVAGAVAHHVGKALDSCCSHLIIENGGDIYIKSKSPISIEVYAGPDSPFTGKLRFQVDSKGKSLGVCTSSASVGHSLSLGKADAVVAIADRADVADAAATHIANQVKIKSDISTVLNRERKRGYLKGIIIVIEDRMGAWGDLTLL
jgi:ApbE superfamily uncharacterized protein (UPF0280 family)